MSVPYAMNLLNGIKLFGRLIKTQFRSESSHASQDANVSYLQHRVGNLNPTSTSPNSYERAVGNMTPSAQMVQQSISSSEDCQQQAVMNNVFRQMSYGGKFGFLHADQFSPSVQSHGHTFNQSFSSQWHQGALSLHKNASIRHALVAHAFNPSTREAEAGRSLVGDANTEMGEFYLGPKAREVGCQYEITRGKMISVIIIGNVDKVMSSMA
ncbi:RNA-binding protein 7 [Cricetulus griseus]|nr:RNA-binding protein 7 [Cricetulus griseus]